MEENDKRVIFYPPGGQYNKMRRKQRAFRQLLQEQAVGYRTAVDKFVFVHENIMSSFPDGAFMLNEDGKLRRLEPNEVVYHLGQKLRDVYNKDIRKKEVDGSKHKKKRRNGGASSSDEESVGVGEQQKKRFQHEIAKLKEENAKLRSANERLQNINAQQIEKIKVMETLLDEKDNGPRFKRSRKSRIPTDTSGVSEES